jgi:hypothetical protein
MANHTVDESTTYVPGLTLGRSGYVPRPIDKMGERIRQLDALMCTLVSSTTPDEGFQNCNPDIQRTVLELASSLATEIHELHEEVTLAELAAADRNSRPAARINAVAA